MRSDPRVPVILARANALERDGWDVNIDSTLEIVEARKRTKGGERAFLETWDEIAGRLVPEDGRDGP